MFTIISYHTPDPYYSKMGRKLRGQLESCGLDHLIAEVDASDGWCANCLKKPLFCFNQLLELDRPLLWLDVDSNLWRDPTAVIERCVADYDVAVAAIEEESKVSIQSAAVFINATPGGLKFVKQWVDSTRALKLTSTDHYHLDLTWKDFDGRKGFFPPGFVSQRTHDPNCTIQNVTSPSLREKKQDMQKIRAARSL